MSAWDGDTKFGLVRALIGTRTCRPFVNLRQKEWEGWGGGGGGEKGVVVEKRVGEGGGQGEGGWGEGMGVVVEKRVGEGGGQGEGGWGEGMGGGGTCGGERNRERYGERGSEGEGSEGPRWRKSERGE